MPQEEAERPVEDAQRLAESSPMCSDFIRRAFTLRGMGRVNIALEEEDYVNDLELRPTSLLRHYGVRT